MYRKRNLFKKKNTIIPPRLKLHQNQDRDKFSSSTQKIWDQIGCQYVTIKSESRKSFLLPIIADLIGKLDCRTLLDYGCGDGSLIELLTPDIEYSLFDTSPTMLNIASNKLAIYSPNVYQLVSQIPYNYYDVIVLSLVLMSVESESEQKFILDNIYKFKKPKGKVIIAVSHPCFRQYQYSSFSTQYISKNFPYLEEGHKFQITIKDSVSNSELSFFDYHWTLSKTINLIIGSRLNLLKVIEVPDQPIKGSFYNRNYPPYLIFICD